MTTTLQVLLSRFNFTILQYEGRIYSYCDLGRKVLLVPCRCHINLRLSTCVFTFHTEIGPKILYVHDSLNVVVNVLHAEVLVQCR